MEEIDRGMDALMCTSIYYPHHPPLQHRRYIMLPSNNAQRSCMHINTMSHVGVCVCVSVLCVCVFVQPGS